MFHKGKISSAIYGWLYNETKSHVQVKTLSGRYSWILMTVFPYLETPSKAVVLVNLFEIKRNIIAIHGFHFEWRSKESTGDLGEAEK